ncbi:MAG: cardiolipin synthase [Clostridia bacterium]
MKSNLNKALKWVTKWLTSRLVITAILILGQVVWMLLFFFQLLDHISWLGVVVSILSAMLALFVINRDENPAYKLSWVMVITLLPVLGGPLYLLFGNKRPARAMRTKIANERVRTRPLLRQTPAPMAKIQAQNPRVAGVSRYISNFAPYPVWENSQTKYYPVGDEMYLDMLEDLKTAEHYIFLEYFIIEDGVMWQSILDILTEKAAQGVDVRLMYDDMGSVTLLPANYTQQMEALGIKCMAFNRFIPLVSVVMNNRDHRKILVIDGHTGYTGGINLADEYINRKLRHGHWKDTGLRVHGDAVWNFTVMFLEMWNTFRMTDPDYVPFHPHGNHPEAFESDGFVQPFGDSPLDNEPMSQNVYIELLSLAHDYVYIYTPYLVIDYAMQTALAMAAKRGVNVCLMTPGIPDKKIIYQVTRSHYPALIKAGVHVYEYTPGFLHAKAFVVDDVLAVVGTINLDFRSLYLHFECGAFLYGCQSIKALRDDALETIAKCRSVSLADCRPGLWGSISNAFLRIFAPLM